MNKTSMLLALALSLFAGASASAENTAASAANGNTTEWAIDATHSHVGFSVPHMVVSEVEGQFTAFSGKVLLDETNLAKSQLEFTAQISSIDTDNADRDKHLKTGDFFDAQKFPTLTFKSTKIVKAGKAYKITGDLTMRGVTKQITLDASLSAAVTSPWGKQVRAAKISGKLDRQDFGVSYNKALDKGGVVVGNEVTLDVKLELNK